MLKAVVVGLSCGGGAAWVLGVGAGVDGGVSAVVSAMASALASALASAAADAELALGLKVRGHAWQRVLPNSCSGLHRPSRSTQRC